MWYRNPMLPNDYVLEMKKFLPPGELDDFLASGEKPPVRGLRVNPLKGDVNALLAASYFTLSPVPWETDGYYYEEADRPGKHVLHELGAYYIQEPSAMLPATLLDVSPGDVVLDFCAAPGGKTTQLAGFMRGEGLLISNELHPTRAKILSENVERLGIRNCIVLNEAPERLAVRFPHFFDKILVDAPCSGEGMFRKNPDAIAEWSLDAVCRCAARQDEILDYAASMLRPGGSIVYATCTFSPLEDEETVERFLSRHPEFSCARMEKLLPHKVQGEGQFAAVLKAPGEPISSDSAKARGGYVGGGSGASGGTSAGRGQLKIPDELVALLITPPDDARLTRFGDQLYFLPEIAFPLEGLKVLRPGLHLGTYKKNRFEPAFALARALFASEVRATVALSAEEAKIYLAGNSLSHSEASGWVLLTYAGYSVAFGKASGGVIKNHYPKGLRKEL